MQKLLAIPSMFERGKDIWILLARIVIASPFLLSGFTKLLSFVQTIPAGEQSVRAVDFLATYLAQSFPFFASMASVSPKMVVAAILIAGLVEIAGGIFIAVGAWTKLSALVMILYTILVSLVFHTGWSLTTVDGQLQLVTFVKNMAIVGGFIMILINGAGAISVDSMRNKQSPGIGIGQRPMI